MSHAAKNLLRGLLAAAWLLAVNALFFWQRFGHSSVVHRLTERLGS